MYPPVSCPRKTLKPEMQKRKKECGGGGVELRKTKKITLPSNETRIFYQERAKVEKRGSVIPSSNKKQQIRKLSSINAKTKTKYNTLYHKAKRQTMANRE